MAFNYTFSFRLNQMKQPRSFLWLLALLDRLCHWFVFVVLCLSLLPLLSISILIYRSGKFVRFSTQSSETVYSHFLLPDSMYTLSCYQPFNATVAGHIAKLWKPEGNEHNVYTSAVLLDAPNWPRDRKTLHRTSTFWYQRISVTSNKYTHTFVLACRIDRMIRQEKLGQQFEL